MRWLRFWIARKLFVGQGPLMVQGRGEWLFFDPWGEVYLIRYTGQRGIPLAITTLRKP